MKTCPFCAEVIEAAATRCEHCGRDLATGSSEQAAPVFVETVWNPRVATMPSLVLPGAGQIYKGEILWGVMSFVAIAGSYLGFATRLPSLFATAQNDFYIAPGLLLHVMCITDAYMGDPDRVARRVFARAQEALQAGAAQEEAEGLRRAARRPIRP